MSGNKAYQIAELQKQEASLRHRGDYHGALQVLDRMIAINPSLSYPYNNKGGILLLLKRYREAIPVLEKAVSLDRSNGQALNNLAYSYFCTGSPERALPLYQEALQKGYTHEGVHYNLGLALLALGRFEEALDEWKLVLRHNPLHQPLINQLYRLGQVVGVIPLGGEVDEELITKIKRELSGCELELIRNRETPDMHLIIRKGSAIGLLDF